MIKGKNATKAYVDAVATGHYERKTGIVGKYDNVRRYWEDDITRIFLRTYLRTLIEGKKRKLERIRILDLGCGSGDGYELLTRIKAKDTGIYEYETKLITPDMLGRYKGIDINPVLLEDGIKTFGGNSKLCFEQGDFSKGLPLGGGEQPYDLYFTSYSTLSHNNDEQTERLLAEIASHCREQSLIVCDWLGRFSYEWQTLWTKDLNENKWIDYTISYLGEEPEDSGWEHFPLRLMCREEVKHLINRASEQAGAEIQIKKIFDRSIFVGRHMNTAQYNPHCQPIRRAVNSLHEIDTRTNLNTLLVDYHPIDGFDLQNRFFEKMQMCWNTLVKFTMNLLSSYDENGGKLENCEIPSEYPEPLRIGLSNMKRIVEGTAWLKRGDARANIIEPQLGYALRELEMDLQEGIGVGHGLVAILDVKK